MTTGTKIFWIIILAILAVVLTKVNSNAQDFNQMFKDRRSARKGLTFQQKMSKYNEDVERLNKRPIDHMGTLAPKRELKTPQNKGKKCGSRYAR